MMEERGCPGNKFGPIWKQADTESGDYILLPDGECDGTQYTEKKELIDLSVYFPDPVFTRYFWVKRE